MFRTILRIYLDAHWDLSIIRAFILLVYSYYSLLLSKLQKTCCFSVLDNSKLEFKKTLT